MAGATASTVLKNRKPQDRECAPAGPDGTGPGTGVCASRRALLTGLATTALAPLGAMATLATPPRHPILVLNSLDADVSVIDPADYTETRRLPTGKEPHHLYMTPDERSVIVANAVSNSLTFVDPATAQVQRTLPRILDPYHLCFSPDMRWFVTAANRLDHVDFYRWTPEAPSPLQLVRRLPATKTPSHLAVDEASQVVYVSLQDSDEVMAVDLVTQTRRWTVRVGRMPADLYLTAQDRLLLVGLTGDRYVEAWDVASSPPVLVSRIATGEGAHAFRARGDGRQVFVSNRVADTVSVLDLQTLQVVDQLPAPGGPDCMEMLADGRTLLVTSRWARRLTCIDVPSRRVTRQVKVGRSPHGVWTLDHAPRR
jgi:YVTN family beta-propeller protein